MDLEQLKGRLHLARTRIHQELDALSKEVGDGIEIDVSVDWLSVATHDNPYGQIPRIEVTARIVP